MATAIEHKNGKVIGVRTDDGSVLGAKTVVIAAGTFLGGRIFIGKKSFEGGRIDEKAANELSASIKRLGFRMDAHEDWHTTKASQGQHRL